MKRIILTILSILFTYNFTLADTSVCSVDFSLVKYGKTNQEVLNFQNFLISEKVMTGKATGFFGSTTQTNIKKYQLKNKLKQTGVLDITTVAFIKSKNCSTVTPANGTTTTTSVSSSNTTSYPFKLEMMVDKYRINPEDQVIFTVKLTNISNATVTNYKLGRYDCKSDNLRLEPNIFYDNSQSFWPQAMFSNLDTCAGISLSSYRQDVPPGKSFEYRVAQKNFSKSTTMELMNYGNVTNGEHEAYATLEIVNSDYKTIQLKSNLVKFYTVVDKSPEFPTVSVSLKTNKQKITNGQFIKLDAVVKNIGKDDYVISYNQPGNISETKQFWIDGIYDLGTFFSAGGNAAGNFVDHDTLFKNYTGTFKVNEEKYYSISAAFLDKVPKDDAVFMKKVQGKHTIQFIVDYKDNFGKTKRYESPKVPFEVELK